MTRRSSVRAQAQEFYREMVEGDARGSLSKHTPLPSPLPQGERGPPAPRGGDRGLLQAGGDNSATVQTDLTARARALYEGSAVPVREIARLAGVSERTLYKYVKKGGWKRRYASVPRGEAASRANRGRKLRPAAGFAPDLTPAKGAGGRFIRREDKDQPFAAGLKALDPAAEAGARAACAEAGRLARIAEADAQAEHWGAENVRAIRMVNQARQALDARDAAQRQKKKTAAPSRQADLCERALLLSLDAALDRMEITTREWERAAMKVLAPADGS